MPGRVGQKVGPMSHADCSGRLSLQVGLVAADGDALDHTAVWVEVGGGVVLGAAIVLKCHESTCHQKATLILGYPRLGIQMHKQLGQQTDARRHRPPPHLTRTSSRAANTNAAAPAHA